MALKNLLSVHQTEQRHWVGDGFPVRTIFSDDNMGNRLDPFLLMDYADPMEFPPSDRQPGVGEHPHRGFETVTIVYRGRLVHRDSAGNHGQIGPGDVQWMTAASGVVHEEKHDSEFAQQGGLLEMIQLWVNLPAASKMTSPRYQTILHAHIPVAYLADGAGSVRIIAGEFHGVKGPAKTFTPIHLYDLDLHANHHVEIRLPLDYHTGLFVRRGSAIVNQSQLVSEAGFALYGTTGEHISIDVKEDTALLVLSGEPINEPTAWAGPFVMNTEEELSQAEADYRAGRMGRLH